MTYFLIAIGSALGGVARYGVGQLVGQRLAAFPLATLLVNVLGSLAIGVAAAISLQIKPSSAQLTRELVIIGFLGGFTTFSAFSLQTLDLLRAGRLPLALANIASSLVLCLLAVWLGHVLGLRLSSPTT